MPRRLLFPPLWVYLFGLFAVAIAQSWLVPPDEHSAFNVALFAVLALAVIVVLTVLQRLTRPR